MLQFYFEKSRLTVLRVKLTYINENRGKKGKNEQLYIYIPHALHVDAQLKLLMLKTNHSF